MFTNPKIAFAVLLAFAVGAAGCGADPALMPGAEPACVKEAAPAPTRVAVVMGSDAASGPGLTLIPCVKSIATGNITFVVRNVGTIDHEMLVLRTDVAADKLPITDAGDPPVPVAAGADKVSEDSSVGETGGENLKPDEKRSFTIKNLKPGRYVLVCNIADHYAMGMRAAFIVTAKP
jgi:uncharacterized cupredoxin-like copper-binding protein